MKKQWRMRENYLIDTYKEEDAEPVLNIFNYYVDNSFAAYPEVQAGVDFVKNLMDPADHLPKYVVKFNNEIVGFAFASRYHPASVFKRVAKLGYFIMPGHTNSGLGYQVLKKLEDQCRQLGVDSLLVHISSLNQPSINFHRKHGFRECGRFLKVGRKFETDFDEVWMQKVL
jgi:phosphinothricin acetyltransferase